jgi:hypothetical protein
MGGIGKNISTDSYSFLSAHSEEFQLAHFPFRPYSFSLLTQTPPSGIFITLFIRDWKKESTVLN